MLLIKIANVTCCRAITTIWLRPTNGTAHDHPFDATGILALRKKFKALWPVIQGIGLGDVITRLLGSSKTFILNAHIIKDTYIVRDLITFNWV